jgi:hypothetical protein
MHAFMCVCLYACILWHGLLCSAAALCCPLYSYREARGLVLRMLLEAPFHGGGMVIKSEPHLEKICPSV